MTVEEVMARVAQIEVQAKKHDDERAHILQDELFADVLRFIAAGQYPGAGEEPWELASESLKVLEIEFSRWCA